MRGPTAFEHKCLATLTEFNTAPCAQDIAVAMKIGAHGRIAVTAALRRLEARTDGKWVGRIPPRDQWGVAYWALGSAAKAWLKENPHD